jgi:uncharacterized protein with GYD domain
MMKYVVLSRWRKKPTRQVLEEARKMQERAKKEGIKILGQYWTFGRWDSVNILEAPDEKAAMKALLRLGDLCSTETLIAISADEAEKFVE